MKKLLVFSFFCFFILALSLTITPAWAASQIIEANGYYCLGDNDTRTQAKNWALQDAKRMALEKAGTYLESNTQVVNGQVTKDEIIAIASGVIKLEKILKEEFQLDKAKNQIIRLKAKFSIDSSDLQKKIAELKSSQQGQLAIKQLEELQARYNQLLAENKSLKEKISKAKDANQREQLEQKSQKLQNLFSASQWLEKGLKLQTEGEYVSALEAYSQVIKLDPKNSIAYNNRGNIYCAQKNYQEAICDYNMSLTIDPKNADTYNNRAVVYNDLGEYEKALADYGSAIRISPKNSYYYNNQGNVYANLKKFSEAIADYSQAIALNSRLAYAYVNRGFAYHALGEIQKAKTDFQTAISLGVNSEILVKIPLRYRL